MNMVGSFRKKPKIANSLNGKKSFRIFAPIERCDVKSNETVGHLGISSIQNVRRKVACRKITNSYAHISVHW